MSNISMWMVLNNFTNLLHIYHIGNINSFLLNFAAPGLSLLSFCRFQTNLDDATDNWGIKVERVEIKDVKLPVQLQRAMAAEAEAAREARAKVRTYNMAQSVSQ